ncbi:deoxynucleoside kinase [Candidatus Woesearchaeota archaeon]|nr:deoxynucleoside kinase [Candidatus Woesearchaeota archaeon]
MAKKVIGLIGNIGAGKSTLGSFIASEAGRNILDEYHHDHDLRYFHESVDEAAKELFYKNRKKHTDPFEIVQAELRVLRHTLAFEHAGIVFFDRTLIEGSETFRRNSFRDGYLTHRANEAYDSIVKGACDNLGRDAESQPRWLESLLVYLKVDDPKILQQRQVGRGDAKEKIIPVEYLAAVNDMYSSFTTGLDEAYGRWGLKQPELLVLDGSKDMNCDKNVLAEHAHKIGEWLRCQQ